MGGYAPPPTISRGFPLPLHPTEGYDKQCEKYFLNWDEAFNSTAAQVGGKGHNLARLHRYGFQIPAGGVLTSMVYRDFLESNGLSDHIFAVASIKAESVLDPAIEKTLTEIREKISNGQISEICIQDLSRQLTFLKLVDNQWQSGHQQQLKIP